jgi:hypothetical protein
MAGKENIRRVKVMRYVTPLREGGSLPAIAEADDGFLYALKFRGAGQGAKALIADLLGGEIARACGFKVPEIVFADLDESFGRTEPDPEIQELLRASEGLNLGLHYLSGAITYDPAVNKIDADTASAIVWLDALLMNVDRTVRNTNMLTWHHELWLIDHGASLYFHHAGGNAKVYAVKPFAQIKDHVLLPYAANLEAADIQLWAMLTPEVITSVAALIPAEWLPANDADKERQMYVDFLLERLKNSSVFLNEAINARESLI